MTSRPRIDGRFWAGVVVGLGSPRPRSPWRSIALSTSTAARRSPPVVGGDRSASRLYEDAFVRAGQSVRCRERRDVAADQLPTAGTLGRLGRVRRQGVGPRGAPRTPLPADPDDVLQLRGVLRAAGLRRQGHRADRQAGGQPGPPGEPRAQLRQGPGDDQPGPRPRADPVPAAARRTAGRGALGADHVGPGAGRDRRAHRHGLPRGPPRRGHVPRRPAGRRQLHRARAARLGHRRPQLAHQHLLVRSTARLRGVDGVRPAVGRPRQRQGDLPHLVAPRGRPLLQPPRAADHRGQDTRGEGHLRRPATVEHGLDERPLARRRGRGPRPSLLLAIARLLLEDGTWDREFVRRWVNWEHVPTRDPSRSRAVVRQPSARR